MDMVNILASLNDESQGKRDFGTSFWNPAKKDIHVSISDHLDSLYKTSTFFHISIQNTIYIEVHT